jgi:hypothetical protein
MSPYVCLSNDHSLDISSPPSGPQISRSVATGSPGSTAISLGSAVAKPVTRSVGSPQPNVEKPQFGIKT